MAITTIDDLTLAGLATALASRQVSSLEATQQALGRITGVDGQDGLNAFITITAESALVAAREADARRAQDDALGPLDGVPIALKDLFDTAGVPTTAGSPVFADRVPTEDATVVRRLAAAGAVIVGKTNMLEFAYGYPHPDIGETANPWDCQRTAGGSSGGSAAAVAAGMAWGALGSDTGGSIRSPAAYCGVTGLKPTYGLVSCAGVVPLSWSLDHAGPIARTAEDCALLLAAIAGHDPADAASAPAVVSDPAVRDIIGVAREAVLLSAEAAPLRGLRLGVVSRLLDVALTPGLRAAFEAALPVFVALGAELVEVDLDTEAAALIAPILERIYTVEAAVFHRQRLRDQAAPYGPVIRAGLEAALAVRAVDYVAAQRDRLRVSAAFAGLFAQADLLTWPTQPMVAPLLETSTAMLAGPAGETSTIAVEIGATGSANLTGEPSLSIPCGFVDGLPVALNLQGPRFADALVLRTGAAFQAAVGPPPLPPLTATPREGIHEA